MPNTSNRSSNPDKPVVTAQTCKAASASKSIASMRQRLIITWLIWLVYRLIGLPVLINTLNPISPDIIGGIAWYGLWLIPAFIMTPSIWRGRSPYALLVDSMLILVYLGASGVILFTRIYGSSWSEIVVYLIDFLLLFMTNIWLFLLLKRLPSMNNVIKKPRSR